jgi:alkanesulfonate monooxygenase SsuD/methylene tetrahydromethanopterin reductase-like flavin-dependent oxidoreductase (luciferase family)
MVQVGLLLSDVPSTVPPAQQFRDIVRVAQTAERNGFTYIAIGQHFLYGDLRWLQPVPLLARLAAEVGPQVRLVTQIMVAPLYHPVLLAEEIATLDIVTEGRLIFGAGLGYRAEEFDYFGIPYRERAPRMDEALALLNKLWTEDEVTFEGRFWSLKGVRPHIKPLQSPHPPIWIGAHSLAGAKRAGKFGDAYATPPETRPHEIAERFDVVRDGFAARGKPFGPQPLRRNVLVADSREEAIVEYARVAKGRYLTYVERGLDLYTGDELERDFIRTVEEHAVLGTPEQVTQKLLELVTTFPVDPLLVRPQWPSMSIDETLAAIERLGREVVPALRGVEPASGVPLATSAAATGGDR